MMILVLLAIFLLGCSDGPDTEHQREDAAMQPPIEMQGEPSTADASAQDEARADASDARAHDAHTPDAHDAGGLDAHVEDATAHDASVDAAPQDARTPVQDAKVAEPVKDASPVDAAPPAPVDASVQDAGPVIPANGSAGCAASTLARGRSTLGLMVGNVMRSAVVFTPSTYDGRTPLPLVLDFHGLAEGGAQHESISGWDDRVDANNFIVAMPQGIDQAWNVGPCCTRSTATDDVAFARALVERIASSACIAPKRVYATGYSNGGGMAYVLACRAADVFAAVAPAAFDMIEGMTCTPSRPISIFIHRGTADTVIPYAGGKVMPPMVTDYPLPTLTFRSAVTDLAAWKTLDTCTGEPNTQADCQIYTQCSRSVQVGLCTKTGGGHDPGNVDIVWPQLKSFTLP